jgi:hypothetical protein
MTNAKARPAPWNAEENTAIVALYFEMLDLATTGQTYSKAAMIRDAQDHENAQTDNAWTGELDARSKGSIEAKLMNVSACHRDISIESGGNAVTMDGYGYRALSNYQATLKDATRSELKRRELQGQAA